MEFRPLRNVGWSKADHSRDGIYWKLTPFGFNPGTDLAKEVRGKPQEIPGKMARKKQGPTSEIRFCLATHLVYSKMACKRSDMGYLLVWFWLTIRGYHMSVPPLILPAGGK